MRTTALPILFAAAILATGLSQAVTVIVETGPVVEGAGFTATNVGDTADVDVVLSVGSWNSTTSTWTEFGSPLAVPGGDFIGGSFTGTGPSTLNGQVVHVFVGNGDSVTEAIANGAYIVFSSAFGEFFLNDLTQPSDPIFFDFSAEDAVNTVASEGATVFSTDVDTIDQTQRIEFVPEPGVAVLGMLGLLTLLRRRR